MAVKIAVRRNTYFDSVSLMAISAQANRIDGVEQAFVAMGTVMNKEVLRNLDLMTPELDDASNGDVMVVISAASAKTADAAYGELEGLLNSNNHAHHRQARTHRTLASAAQEATDAKLAVISVNGMYAVREARNALDSGLHVMLFSDNVSLADELALKELAHDRGLLMMGPDCGTAIIAGVALCFGNAVRAGNIGIVGASGTGSQEISVRIHDFGGGVSQLIGTGGRDLSEAIGGIMMRDGLRALEEDPHTDVIVLISKPPDDSVAETVLADVEGCRKPVIVCFLGGLEDDIVAAGGIFAKTTKAAALAAVLATGVNESDLDLHPLNWPLIEEVRAKLKPEQRYIRGLFCGGTLCDEAMGLAVETHDDVYSNVHKRPDYRVTAHEPSVRHTFLDLGDDDLTRTRPHPMIDPTSRIERFRREAEDPEVGVIALDFILGYGSHEDPVGVMLPEIVRAKEAAHAAGRHLEVLGYVLGTDDDRPGLSDQVRRLDEVGVTIASSNTNLGLLSREFVSTGGPE
jgi:succinyl-CoA synthetase alpha subunit